MSLFANTGSEDLGTDSGYLLAELASALPATTAAAPSAPPNPTPTMPILTMHPHARTPWFNTPNTGHASSPGRLCRILMRSTGIRRARIRFVGHASHSLGAQKPHADPICARMLLRGVAWRAGGCGAAAAARAIDAGARHKRVRGGGGQGALGERAKEQRVPDGEVRLQGLQRGRVCLGLLHREERNGAVLDMAGMYPIGFSSSRRPRPHPLSFSVYDTRQKSLFARAQRHTTDIPS